MASGKNNQTVEKVSEKTVPAVMTTPSPVVVPGGSVAMDKAEVVKSAAMVVKATVAQPDSLAGKMMVKTASMSSVLSSGSSTSSLASSASTPPSMPKMPRMKKKVNWTQFPLTPAAPVSSSIPASTVITNGASLPTASNGMTTASTSVANGTITEKSVAPQQPSSHHGRHYSTGKHHNGSNFSSSSSYGRNHFSHHPPAVNNAMKTATAAQTPPFVRGMNNSATPVAPVPTGTPMGNQSNVTKTHNHSQQHHFHNNSRPGGYNKQFKHRNNNHMKQHGDRHYNGGKRFNNHQPPKGAYYNGVFVPHMDPKVTAEQAKKQLEYYFSPENLVRDIFLRQNMDVDGYVPVIMVANFQAVYMIHQDYASLLDALRSSTVVELDLLNEKIRVRDGWQKWLWPNFSGGFGLPRYLKLNPSMNNDTQSRHSSPSAAVCTSTSPSENNVTMDKTMAPSIKSN